EISGPLGRYVRLQPFIPSHPQVLTHPSPPHPFLVPQEISGPLGRYVRLFPRRAQLHPFESCLVELTLGDGVYEEVRRGGGE
ncbi:unnamed protein product, partial [Closterium sp. NIES-53]